VGQNDGPNFRRLWTKVHQIWQACTGGNMTFRNGFGALRYK